MMTIQYVTLKQGTCTFLSALGERLCLRSPVWGRYDAAVVEVDR